LDALGHAPAALNVWRSLFGGVCAHDRAARPDVGLKCAGLNQHHLDAERASSMEVSNPKPLEEPVMRAILSGMETSPLGL
jgi:hypothetical protein